MPKKGGYCPRCKSTDIILTQRDEARTSIVDWYGCDHCDESWGEEYQKVFKGLVITDNKRS